MSLAALGTGLVLIVAAILAVPATAQTDACQEPNDDPASACMLTSGAAVQSTMDRPGDADFFRFDVGVGGGQAQIGLSNLPADYDLYLVDANGGVLGQSVHEGTASEQLQLTLQPGTYFAIVQADPSREVDPSRPYELHLAIGGPTATAVPMASSSVSARRVLLSDSFNNPSTGFLPTAARNNPQIERDYVDGEYSLRVIDPQNTGSGFQVPGSYTDAILSVDIRLIGETAGRSIQIECRRQPGWVANTPTSLSSYKLRVYPASREYEVVRIDAGKNVLLTPRSASTAINRDTQVNHLELGCIGTTISARANDQDLASIDDGAYSAGISTINISGLLSAMPRVEARIDNLVVYGP